MDPIVADISAFLGRGTEFVTGIDNEGIDFSQLEDFINNDGSTTQNFPFSEHLTATPPSSGKILIVENKRNNNGHSLPDSPPDSSSEHPYSPQDEAPLNASDNLYTNLGQNIFKQAMLNPISTDNLILESQIVVTDLNNDGLMDSSGLLQDNRLLITTQSIRNGNNSILTNRILTDGITNDHNILLTDAIQDRQILLPNVHSDLTSNNNNSNANNTNGNNNNYNRSRYEQKDYSEDKHIVHLGFTTRTTSSPSQSTSSTSPMDTLQTHSTNLDSTAINMESNLENVYTNLQNAPKKRKLSRENSLVKSEPDQHCSNNEQSDQFATSSPPIKEEYATSESCLSDSQYQCIRFSPFQQTNWHLLCDQNLTEVSTPHYRVDADKGFNFSNADDAFVCQKKNHFQITCHVQLLGDAQFVKTPDGFQKISSFYLHFYGVKHDCPTQTIRVEQSQSDRSKKPFHPVLVQLSNSQITKVTVGRLHFSETTSNNMRKKGKPNPEQRYFQLVVGLHAHTTNGNFPVISHASQKIIVRASNPGQFESDVELCWQKGQTQDSVFYNGKVGVNTDRPDESLVVHGNIKITGHIIQPSDIRAKKNIVELNTAEQLKNVQRLRVVRYEYEPGLASQLNKDRETSDTGVIAQEVAQVLPEAVKPAGSLILDNGTAIDNFLVVNKERIFMENIGAVKELCKVTDNLETRIDQLERINRRLNKLKRGDSMKSNSTVNSSKTSHYSDSTCKCSKRHKCKSCEMEVELCSNKVIQVVIVLLVLIMASCLAAITTLYLLESTRHNEILKASIESVQNKMLTTKKPTIIPKTHSTWATIAPHKVTNVYQRDDELAKITHPNLVKTHSYIIGRPNECLTVEQDLESSNLCQIYCCAAPLNHPSSIEDISQTIYSEKRPPIINKTKSGLPPTFKEQQNSQTALEKNKISRLFHSNDIDKQIRTRRHTYDNLANSFDQIDTIDDHQLFIIIIQGRNFSATLSQKYLKPSSNSYNISYSVPISKYMPDDFINIVFHFVTPMNKEIQYCYNDFKHYECPYISSVFYDDKSKRAHKVNETKPSQFTRGHSVTFDVDMADYQSKVLTYRVALNSNNQENLCDLSETKLLGRDFFEYNFHFYRQCDE